MWGRIAAMIERHPLLNETEFLRSLKRRVAYAADLHEHVENWGAECYIKTDSRDPRKIYATTWEPISSLEAKKIFYTNRFLRAIFPNNFPKIHIACGAKEGATDGYWTGTIREKVMPGEKDNTDLFLEVLYLFRELFEVPLNVDFSKRNIMTDKRGTPRYVDTYAESPLFKKETNDDIGMLRTRLLEAGYSATRVNRALNSLVRLRALSHFDNT